MNLTFPKNVWTMSVARVATNDKKDAYVDGNNEVNVIFIKAR